MVLIIDCYGNSIIETGAWYYSIHVHHGKDFYILYSKQLAEHCKPDIMEKIKIIKNFRD